MREKFPSKTLTMMISITGALVVMLIFMMGTTLAQVGGGNGNCPDKCENDALYLKGAWDDKLNGCVYATEQPCRYGCEDNPIISQTPACKEFPDEPPVNTTEYDETLWEMIKRLFDKKRTEIKIDIHGTEYVPDEEGIVFLQLLNGNNEPINDTDSTCFASIYYPDASVWLYQQRMLYADEGLFYYRFDVPYTSGVYIVSGLCTIPDINVTKHEVNEDFESGGGVGGVGWSADWNLTCDIGPYGPQSGSFNLRCLNDEEANRTFEGHVNDDSISYIFYRKIQGLESGEYWYVYLCDSDDQCFELGSWTNGDDDNIWHAEIGTLYRGFDGFNLTGNSTFKINNSGNLEVDDKLYLDSINFTISEAISINQSEYQIIRGSGEIHVSSDQNYYVVLEGLDNTTGTGQSWMGFMWENYTIISGVSEVTDDVKITLHGPWLFPCSCVLLQGVEIQNTTNSSDWDVVEIHTFWNPEHEHCDYHFHMELEPYTQHHIRSKYNFYWNKYIETYKKNEDVMYDSISGICVSYQTENGLPAYAVPLTSEPSSGDDFYDLCEYYMDVYDKFSNIVYVRYHNWLNNNFTGPLPDDVRARQDGLQSWVQNFKAKHEDLQFISSDILSQLSALADYSRYINGSTNFTDYAKFLGNMSNDDYIMSYIEGMNNLSASDVWTYATRTLTDYNLTEVLDYLSTINGTAYDIRAFQLNELSNNLTEIQIWLEYINGTANSTYDYLAGLVNLTALDIWGFAQRNLTYYPNQTDLTNYTLIQVYVWNHTNRTLTPYNSTVLRFVGGTEYQSGETGKAMVQLLQNVPPPTIPSTVPITGANCNLTAIYPNESIWLSNVSMDEIVGSDGIYRANFTVPDTVGVYLGQVRCEKSGDIFHASGSLHVAPWANKIKGLNNLSAEDVWNFASRNLTYFNYTPIFDDIDSLNTSILNEIQNTNTSLWNAVVNANSSILARLDAHNGTIMTKLYLLQDEIADMNASIIGEIGLVNSSLYQAIVDANVSIIGRVNQHNSTVMMYLYNMQDDIDDILIDTLTIINDIADVYNVTDEIWWLVWNLTIGNVSVSATVNWTEGAIQMNNISNPIIVESQLLTFAGRDQTPVQVISYDYCLDNTTLAYDINTTRCWLDQCFIVNETMTEICDYGCYQGACNPEPFDRITFLALIFLFVIAIIVGIAFVYDRFSR